ncbi:hypothetical protein B0H34DRAFT_61143 [Crassisporium funariophilum]|nr:hypothetical protein B0H34DRAFT_61143 [Crassisporium funariophilum]
MQSFMSDDDSSNQTHSDKPCQWTDKTASVSHSCPENPIDHFFTILDQFLQLATSPSDTFRSQSPMNDLSPRSNVDDHNSSIEPVIAPIPPESALRVEESLRPPDPASHPTSMEARVECLEDMVRTLMASAIPGDMLLLQPTFTIVHGTQQIFSGPVVLSNEHGAHDLAKDFTLAQSST